MKRLINAMGNLNCDHLLVNKLIFRRLNSVGVSKVFAFFKIHADATEYNDVTGIAMTLKILTMNKNAYT